LPDAHQAAESETLAFESQQSLTVISSRLTIRPTNTAMICSTPHCAPGRQRYGIGRVSSTVKFWVMHQGSRDRQQRLSRPHE
jgi:hypothetical protein